MNRSPNMPRFLLGSLCLHLAIAVPWLSAFQFSGHRETVLTITLDAPERPIAPAASRAASASATAAEKDVVAAITPIVAPASAMGHTAPRAPVPGKELNKDSTEDDSDGAHTESARAQIQAQLLVELQRYFEYPLLARRRGWEGTVLLSFVVESDGALRRIQVARGSGYDLLDNSAVAAVHRVERLTEARHWLDGRSLQMDIPVIYRLKER